MVKSDSLPYWRLSGFYLFYFATLGAFIPYWNLYLQSLAFSPAEIGELTAIVVATRMFSPVLWGWLADRSGCRIPLIQLASLLSVICFAGVFVSQHYWWLAIVMFLFGFFWNAGIPQVDAVTLSFLGENTHRYGHIRLWGPVGFIITVISLGRLLEIESITLLPVIMLVLFLAIWFVSLTIPKQ
ncbi:MAG: MFS transporter, partial [Gammaproteobacteria bacterium]|nr:MFS transporter [Gammaproteobacteria bacterium]